MAARGAAGLIGGDGNIIWICLVGLAQGMAALSTATRPVAQLVLSLMPMV